MTQLQFGLARIPGGAIPYHFGTLQSLDPLADVPARARALAAAGQLLQEPVLAQWASQGVVVLRAFRLALVTQLSGEKPQLAASCA